MCRHNQVALFNHHVVDRRHRQISRHPLPRPAIVERDENPRLRAYVEQPLSRRVRPQHARDLVLRKGCVDAFPASAPVRSLEQIRAVFVQLIARRRQVDRRRVVRARLDHRHEAPLGQIGRRNIPPAPAAVFADVDQAVVTARPEYAGLVRRLDEHRNRAVVLRPARVQCQRPARRLQFALVIPCQIRADNLP